MRLTTIRPGDIVLVDNGMPTTRSSSSANVAACVSDRSDARSRHGR